MSAGWYTAGRLTPSLTSPGSRPRCRTHPCLQLACSSNAGRVLTSGSPPPLSALLAHVPQKARDECTTTYGPEDPKCAPLIEAHKVCLRKEGFNVSPLRQRCLN